MQDLLVEFSRVYVVVAQREKKRKRKIKRNNEIVKQGGKSIKKIEYILARFLLPAACSWSDIVG